MSLQQVRIQVGIGKVQNCAKCRLILIAVLRVARLEIAEQKLVELPHAAPTLPAETGVPAQYFRSASILLVAAMACAGLRPFGHVCVQFMIV